MLSRVMWLLSCILLVCGSMLLMCVMFQCVVMQVRVKLRLLFRRLQMSCLVISCCISLCFLVFRVSCMVILFVCLCFLVRVSFMRLMQVMMRSSSIEFMRIFSVLVVLFIMVCCRGVMLMLQEQMLVGLFLWILLVMLFSLSFVLLRDILFESCVKFWKLMLLWFVLVVG